MSAEPLSVDDLVTGLAAEQLGEGVIPTAAVLIVQTIEEAGPGLRYVKSKDLPSWSAIGMLRSSLLRIEDEDLRGWGGSDEDLT